MAAKVGLEPTTNELTARRSTIELFGNITYDTSVCAQGQFFLLI